MRIGGRKRKKKCDQLIILHAHMTSKRKLNALRWV